MIFLSMMKLTPLQQLILYILKFAEENGYDNLSKFQIMKLVYLIDVEHRRYLGEPFINDLKFQRDTNGPISTNIYDAIKPMEGNYITISKTKTDGYNHPRECHKIKNSKEVTFNYSREEKIFLNCVLSDYIQLTQKKLKEIAYSTEPMMEVMHIENKKGVNTKGMTLNMDRVPLDEDIVDAIADSSK